MSAALLTTAASAQVKVGVIEGLSGPPAIVDFGESYLQGIKLALKDYEANKANTTKIELVVYDDEANPQRAVTLAQRLIQNDKAPVVIGTVSSGNVLAMSPIFQKAAVPLMAGGEMIGIFAVSGAPGGDKDEVCVRAGMAKIADRIK